MATNKELIIDVLVTELTNLRITFVNLSDDWCREQVRDQIAQLEAKLKKAQNWSAF